ncbi:MAG: hypothetical protein QGI83_15215, partial [Candidatus Latescibacteria bacterium]|nr:hypothetical protein [Candidatus Latescibacterota bacterium]
MGFTETDRSTIRDLAKRVAQIASDPVNDERRELWTRLNRLERVRPLIHVQAIAWNIWEELIPPDELETTDPFFRQQEQNLRQQIYCWEHFQDDRVVDDIVTCPIVVRGANMSTCFGIDSDLDRPEDRSGAYAFRPVIAEEAEIDKIRTDIELTVDQEETERRYSRLCDLYDGTLRVEKRGSDFFWFQPTDMFMKWRTIEQMFVDLVERPEWVHAALERVTEAYLNHIEQMEKLGVLASGNGNTRLG